MVEPWLRGIDPSLNPVIAHLLRASLHIREDSEAVIRELTPAQLWARPHEMTSAGFHAKHLAGSTQRLCTYLEGMPLSEGELRQAAAEGHGEETAEQLMVAIHAALDRYEASIRTLDAGSFASVREVGRNKLPVTAISLAIHIAEHGLRHVGQLIGAAKLARAGW